MGNFENLVNDNFESQIVEILYSTDAHEDVKDLHFGTVHNNGDQHDTSGVEHRITRLMDEIAPDDISWPRLFLGGSLGSASLSPFIRFSEADKRHFELHGKTLGGFITQLVYEKLPIEWSTEGESSVALSIAVDNDYILNLSGRGTFDTAYTYDHEGADLEVDDPSDSEIIYEMTFTADLFYCPIPSREK